MTIWNMRISRNSMTGYFSFAIIGQNSLAIYTMKPKDVKDMGISERGLRNIKQKIRNGSGLKKRSKIIKILFKKRLNKDN